MEVVFLLIVIAIYGGINFYLYARLQAALLAWFPGMPLVIFAIVFWVLASLFLVSQLSRHIWGYSLPVLLIKIGYYWLAAMFYSVLAVVVVDLLRLSSKLVPALQFINNPHSVSLVIMLVIIVVVAGGAWNSRHPVITHYDLSIAKAASKQPLHIVMVSDLHLGVVVDKARLAKLVQQINQLKPDLVVMPGDVIDEDLEVFVRENMGEELKKIKAPYGVYACLGNHEYYSGRTNDIDYYLKQAGVTLLQDQAVLIGNSFYLAGRSMKSENPLERRHGARLADTLSSVDHSKPVLVMDHVPARLPEASAAGVDLLFCGHTHLGQMWPLNYITRRVFVSDYGHYQKQSFQALISNGVGTWGPPIRVGNRPEIVDINLSFTSN